MLVHRPREALVVMHVPGDDRVRPDAGSRAGAVDVGEHLRAASMGRIAAERRVVHGDDDGSGILLALDALERSGEKRNLAVVEHGVRAVFVRDDARVFEHVAVQAQDAHERRIEGVVDAGLNHGGSHQASCIGSHHRLCGAEVGR